MQLNLTDFPHYFILVHKYDMRYYDDSTCSISVEKQEGPFADLSIQSSFLFTSVLYQKVELVIKSSCGFI